MFNRVPVIPRTGMFLPGTAISSLPLSVNGKASAWFFDNHCAILSSAKELYTPQKKRTSKGTAAD